MSEYLPGLAGVPATQSNISDIDGEKGLLSYRGYSIEELAKNSSFEETTLLLLDGRLPSASELDEFKQQLVANRVLKFTTRGMMKNLPPAGHPMDMLQTVVASLGMYNPNIDCLIGGTACTDINYIHNTTVKIMARVSSIVAMWQHIREG